MNTTLVTALAIVVGILAVILAASGIIAWRAWRAGQRPLTRRLSALRFRDKLRLGWRLLVDPQVPLWSRILVGVLILYLAMPLDIVPDFIPVLGLLDDLLVVLVAAWILVRSIPGHVLEEHLFRLEEEKVPTSDTLP